MFPLFFVKQNRNSDIIGMANIVLYKNTINRVVVALSHTGALINPYYLFVFRRNINTSDEFASVVVQNTSQHIERYDLVEITETSPAVALDGEITLEFGEWAYDVYESITPTTDINNTTGRIIKRGLAIVTEQNGVN